MFNRKKKTGPSSSGDGPGVPIKADSHVLVLEETSDDFIYIVSALNKHGNRITISHAGTDLEANQAAKKFASSHAGDRYWLNKAGQVVTSVESRRIARSCR
jgi:hypothetical protein